ncbi:MAG: AzlD domain-containing protein [Halopseudomonas sp.]
MKKVQVDSPARIKLPALLVIAVDFVPTAVLTNSIVQEALIRAGAASIAPDNHHRLGVITATITPLIRRNLLLTIGVGLVFYGLVRWVV